MNGDLSIAVAIGAGLLSFLSPCVLPLVPAYLGQLTAVALVGSAEQEAGIARGPSRWLAVRHGLAYVAGFGLVFTLLGLTAPYVAGPLVDYLPLLRQLGGVVLILLGLNLAGVLRIPALDRSWRPLESGAAGSLATTTGTVALSMAGGGNARAASLGDRLGGRIVGTRGGWLASFGLGAIFAIGWTPCIGFILGGILMLAATSGSTLQGGLLLIAYTAGLGIPFVAIAAVYDRAPRLIGPLVRHGQLVSAVSGGLVVLIGFAMLFDWLALLPQYFQFNSAI
jgi:cytochrome c-type biogenesis protein